MLARIFTALFYAAVFFYLGAWSGGHFRPIWQGIEGAAVATGERAVDLSVWLGITSADRAQGTTQAVAPEAAAGSAPATAAATGFADQMAAARDAFARGDTQHAITGYRAAVTVQPDDPDALGELGNVYFSAGQTAQAATAFHAAAVALLARGDAAAARALEPAIRAGAPALADDLLHRFAAAPGQNP